MPVPWPVHWRDHAACCQPVQPAVAGCLLPGAGAGWLAAQAGWLAGWLAGGSWRRDEMERLASHCASIRSQSRAAPYLRVFMLASQCFRPEVA